MRLSILIKFVILILDKFVNRLIGIVLKDLIGKIAQEIRLIAYLSGESLSASIKHTGVVCGMFEQSIDISFCSHLQ